MKITFPHLGDVHIVARLLFMELGIDFVIPEMNTQKTLERGSAISPEEMCLPFKIMAGNLINAFENGADTVIMPATGGPCRLGEYAELLHSVLKRNGIEFEWIIIESPSQIGINELKKRLKKVLDGKHVSTRRALYLLNQARKLQQEIDAFKARTYIMAGKAKNPSACKKIIRNCMEELILVKSMKQAFDIVEFWIKRLDSMEIYPEKDPVQLILTGEIYTLIDPFANHNIAEKLMELGVSFEKRVTVSWWIERTIKEALGKGPLHFFMSVRKENEAYLPHSIGGYSKETVEEGVICNRENYDGMIQIFPSGCMPEIVAKSVLNKMATEMDIRMLNIIFDEMDGEAGYITRIEAFVDMLCRLKEIDKNREN